MPFFDFVRDAGEQLAAARQRELDQQAAAAAAARQRELDQQTAETRAQAQAAQVAYDESMAAALSDRLADLGLPSEDVFLSFAEGVVTVNGEIADPATHELVLLALGNVAGVERIDDQLHTPDLPEPQLYTVQKGDTLSKIAARFYGKGSRYPEIFKANQPLLKDPNRIYPGQVLRIPRDTADDPQCSA